MLTFAVSLSLQSPSHGLFPVSWAPQPCIILTSLISQPLLQKKFFGPLCPLSDSHTSFRSWANVSVSVKPILWYHSDMANCYPQTHTRSFLPYFFLLYGCHFWMCACSLFILHVIDICFPKHVISPKLTQVFLIDSTSSDKARGSVFPWCLHCEELCFP